MCSRKIGHAVNALQNATIRGTEKKISDLNLNIIKEIETEDYFKTVLKNDVLKDIKDQIEVLKNLRTNISQYHGDLSPHNIIIKENQVYLLDYSFQVNATFLDPVSYTHLTLPTILLV